MSEIVKSSVPGKPNGTLESVLNNKALTANPDIAKQEEPQRNSLFSFSYKVGSISRSEVIRAFDQADAEVQINRFLKFKSYGSFQKYLLMGKITPFAINVDSEIEKFNKRCEREGTPGYTESSSAVRVQPLLQG